MARDENQRSAAGVARVQEVALATDKPHVDYSVLRYDYAALPAEHRLVLQDAAVEIHGHHAQAKRSMLAIGQRLLEVKDLLPHGQFEKWIAGEFGYKQRTVQEFMNAARRFGGKSAIIALLNDTTIRLLAAPSVPDAAVDEVIEAAQNSTEPIKVEEVKRIVEAHRPPSKRTVNVKAEPRTLPQVPRPAAPDPATLPKATVVPMPQPPPPIIRRPEPAAPTSTQSKQERIQEMIDICQAFHDALTEIGAITRKGFRMPGSRRDALEWIRELRKVQRSL
jgi:hypothetical protein